MPCIFCMAALAVAAVTIVPALLDQMEGRLMGISTDLTRTAESDSMVQWNGTFAFQDSTGHARTAAAQITLYKASSRARIQVMTHQLDPRSNELLEDTIANALGATIVSRHVPDQFEPEGEHEHASGDEIRVPTPPQSEAPLGQ